MRIEEWRQWYWIIAGGLTGFALLGGWLLGLLLGGALLVVSAILWRGKEFWLAVVAVGALPALILAFDIITAPPPCPTTIVMTSPDQSYYTCGELGPGYYELAAIFAGIALLGIAWPLARWLWTRQRAR